MKGLPRAVRLQIQERLWIAADIAGFLELTDAAKSRCYDNWAEHPEIGGRLVRYMNATQVRHYIKDAYLKRYARERRADPTMALRAVGLAIDTPIATHFIKPLGITLADGRIICWGEAKIWKAVLMSLHERAYGGNGLKPMAAILFPHARFQVSDSQRLVEDAATKLGIERVIWL